MAEKNNKFKIVIRHSEEKNLYKIPFPWRDRIEKAIDFIGDNPFCGEKMSGELQDLRKIRVRPYRVIYQIYEKQRVIYIEQIRHRGDVSYK